MLAVSGEHEGRKRFDAFVVEANTPGLTRELDDKVRGLVPLGHCGLRLVGCRVPESHRLGEPGQAFDTIARPFRAIEDALLLGAMLGAMQAELDTLARWFRNAARTPALTRDLGALQLELDALSPVARHAAQHLDRHGPDEALAAFNLGARRLFDRWQGACESFAAALDDHEPALLALARDLRLVLGIARGIADSRQLRRRKMLRPKTMKTLYQQHFDSIDGLAQRRLRSTTLPAAKSRPRSIWASTEKPILVEGLPVSVIELPKGMARSRRLDPPKVRKGWTNPRPCTSGNTETAVYTQLSRTSC